MGRNFVRIAETHSPKYFAEQSLEISEKMQFVLSEMYAA